MSNAVYQVITDRICTLLQAGTVPWHRPWRMTVDANGRPTAALPRNLTSGRPYNGANAFILGAAGFASPYWITFKQAQARGGTVRKGEHGFPVIFWKVSDTVRTAADGSQERGKSFLLRYYTVFNVAQCDGIDAPSLPAAPTAPEAPAIETIPQCEAIVGAMPQAPTIREGEPRAWYMQALDLVNMPRRSLFNSAAEWYSTLFHELAHSTGHESRLARKTLTDACAFGSTNYSKEELVAEMTAAFLCGVAGIENRTIDNSAAYLANWLRKLQDNPKWIVEAGAQAQKAADYIQGKTKGQETAEAA